MVAYGKAMRPSLVDVMAETNALASEMDKKIVLIVNYHGSVWPSTATLEHTDGTTVTYDELASIANTVVIAFDTYLGAAALADIQKQIDDSIQITYQDSRYDDTTQAIIYDKVTVYVESGETPTVNIETDTFSGGSYTLPTASADTLGGVKVGSGLAIDSEGVLSGSIRVLKVENEDENYTLNASYNDLLGMAEAGVIAVIFDHDVPLMLGSIYQDEQTMAYFANFSGLEAANDNFTSSDANQSMTML